MPMYNSNSSNNTGEGHSLFSQSRREGAAPILNPPIAAPEGQANANPPRPAMQQELDRRDRNLLRMNR